MERRFIVAMTKKGREFNTVEESQETINRLRVVLASNRGALAYWIGLKEKDCGYSGKLKRCWLTGFRMAKISKRLIKERHYGK